MRAPRAMTSVVIGLPTKSQGDAAFLRRQRRSGARRPDHRPTVAAMAEANVT
jgi:hypothetical protein